MAAAYVIYLDRGYRRRSQIENLGIWGEANVLDHDGKNMISPRIHIRNMGSLPLYVKSIEYNVIFVVRTGGTAALDGFEVMQVSAGYWNDLIVPPGELNILRGESVDPPHFPSWDCAAVLRNARVLVRSYEVFDSSHRLWSVEPKTDFMHEVLADEQAPYSKLLKMQRKYEKKRQRARTKRR
ncbi:hypothetical protein [Phytoactinopolyspora endophytica]|uniref:hypothetical protein n=1 Tax=Phytoactinopolyspora endophytica TaxID=1642495 RepID=UPI00101CFE77|nr:hypothetical protein [Phytoactinopolyspora endophytica]